MYIENCVKQKKCVLVGGRYTEIIFEQSSFNLGACSSNNRWEKAYETSILNINRQKKIWRIVNQTQG